MEITGKIIAVCEYKNGVSQRSGKPWATQEYVLETVEQYPKKCCFEVFGEEKIQNFAIHTGDEVRVSFDIDSHEHQGRWYNSIRAWKVDHIGQGTRTPAQAAAEQQSYDPFAGGGDDTPY